MMEEKLSYKETAHPGGDQHRLGTAQDHGEYSCEGAGAEGLSGRVAIKLHILRFLC